MIVQRFYDPKLAQASYLIGCAATGESVIVDANRDVGQYITAAERENLQVTHVTETHIHADFVSGSRELARRTGAKLYLSSEGGPDWQYAFAEEAGAILLKDRDEFAVGNVQLRAVHTPGHTPEHMSFLVTDQAAANEPIAMVTGDFVFVGDVGRPDLLERAARVEGTMEQGARDLFRSLARFKEHPEWLQIWPGHGAGSACGKGLSAVPHSTVGYERRFNWAFRVEDEDEFVRMVLEEQPEPPRYFAEMKRINRDGPRVLGVVEPPKRLPARAIKGALDKGSLVVDTRRAAEYADAHIPGTISIPLNRAFTTWAGWLVPYDRDFYLIVDEHAGATVDEAFRDLAMIGLDRVAGFFSADAVAAWGSEGGELGAVPHISSKELKERFDRGEVAVLDIRGQAEWAAGHLPGVSNIPLGFLPERMGQVPNGRPLVVHCQSGGRSAIAASVLLAHGRRDILNLSDGYAGWQARGYPVEHEPVEAAV